MQRRTDGDQGRRACVHLRLDRLGVIHRLRPLHVSTLAFYVYPNPLQPIGPFSRVRSAYIIQQMIPPLPSLPRLPRPARATKTFRCELISTLPDTPRLCLLRFYRAASTTCEGGWLVTRRLTMRGRRLKEVEEEIGVINRESFVENISMLMLNGFSL